MSITSDCSAAAELLPAASVAVTLTAFEPLAFSDSVPLTGVALKVSTLQRPPEVAVVT